MKPTTPLLLFLLTTLLPRAHSYEYGCVDVWDNGLKDDRCPGGLAKFCVYIQTAGNSHPIPCDHGIFNVRRYWQRKWLPDKEGNLVHCPDDPDGAWACMGGWAQDED